MKIKTLKSIHAIIGEKSSTLPILENFYIVPEFLFFSNLSISVRVTHKFPIAKDSKAVIIKARHFLRRMEYIKAPFSIIANEAYGIEFSTPDGTSSFPGMDTGEFDSLLSRAPMPKETDVPMMSISAWDVHLLDIARMFTAIDELRPVMQIVVMDQQHIVASDAHKLYYRKINKEFTEQVMFDRKVIALMKLGQGQEFKLYKVERNYCAVSEDMTIWWRILESTKAPDELFYSPGIKYPRWQSVIPNPEHRVIIPVKELIYAINSISYAANMASGRIAFEIKGTKLILKASDLDFDIKASEQVNILNPDSYELKFGFKMEYILHILRTLQEEGHYQVEMGIVDETRAFLFAGQLLLMPMMIN